MSYGELAAPVKSAVARGFEVPAPGVVFVNRGGIHLTTSGKVQRASMRAAFLKGELTDVLHEEHPEQVTDIAVVGLDCRFPKADDPAALWKLLLDGADGIDEIPAERWNAAELQRRRHRQPPSRRADQRRRCLRQRLLRHHPARGRGDGSAATPPPADGMASARKRHPRPARAGRFQHRSVRRRDGQRMGPSAHERLPRDHGAGRFGQRLLHDREPALLPTRPQGPEPRGRHRLLVVAGRSAFGRAGAAQCGMRPGDRRRRQPHTDPRPERLLHEGRLGGPRRALQTVQRQGRRNRPRRGRCRRRPAPPGGRGRRGPADLRRDQGQRGQQRRPQQRHHRAEPLGAAAGRRHGVPRPPGSCPRRSASSRHTAPEPSSAT